MPNQNKKVILEVQNLKKYFHNKQGVVNAINGLDLKIHEGEIVGLVGESGSGKTTVGRSLVRLYDDYSGFVSLENKVISGKKISKQTRKFMRKNVQMIFQDPHASLNSQKNVFSILKEPLQVNDILKNETKEVLKDIEKVQKNFKYSFRLKYLKTRIDNMETITKISARSLVGWLKTLNAISFDDYTNLDDAFSSYFLYYEKQQKVQSEMVSHIYDNSQALLDYYYKKQHEVRSKELDEDEKELFSAQEQLEYFRKIEKHTEEKYQMLQRADAQKYNLNNYITHREEIVLNSKNLIRGYREEFHSEYELLKLKAQNSLLPNEYTHYKSMSEIHRYAAKLLKPSLKNPKHLEWLSLNEIKEFVAEIRKYGNAFIEKCPFKQYSKNYKKDLIGWIHQNWNFYMEKYVVLAHQQHQEFNAHVAEQKQSIKNLLEKIKTTTFTKVNYDKKLARLEEAVAVAKEKHEKEVALYLKKFEVKNKSLEARLEEAKTQYRVKVRPESQALEKVFLQKHKDFLLWAKHKLEKENLSKSIIDKKLKQYETKFEDKLKTIQSFVKEIKFLGHSNEEIAKLFGVKEMSLGMEKIPFVKKWLAKRVVKKILLKEKIYQALEDVGLLKQFAYRYPHEFSGGQRQRIVIARALITQPKLIIADEPIASLDISIQAQIINLLKTLGKEKNIGMLFIAHDLSMVEYITDNILIMHLGKVVERGQTEKIYKKPLHPYTINLFDSIPKMSNANEPFKVSKFTLEYLQEQEFPAQPSYHEVGKNHEIFGTDAQVARWTKKK